MRSLETSSWRLTLLTQSAMPRRQSLHLNHRVGRAVDDAGACLLAYGVADVTFGNGLIAAFVCGISLAVAEHDIADDFVVFSENVSSILQVLTFFAFGGLIVATGYHADIPLLVAFIAFALLIARPVAITLSFFRVGLPAPHRRSSPGSAPRGWRGSCSPSWCSTPTSAMPT